MYFPSIYFSPLSFSLSISVCCSASFKMMLNDFLLYPLLQSLSFKDWSLLVYFYLLDLDSSLQSYFGISVLLNFLVFSFSLFIFLINRWFFPHSVFSSLHKCGFSCVRCLCILMCILDLSVSKAVIFQLACKNF